MSTTYAYTAALMPKLPPESGGVISRSFDPGSPRAAAATEWSVKVPESWPRR